MKLWDGFKTELKGKRRPVMGAIGIVLIGLGISNMLSHIYLNLFQRVMSIFLILFGTVLLVISSKHVSGMYINALSKRRFKVSLDSDRLSNLMDEKRILIRGPKIVAIGGGTGLSTMLRGLKDYSSNITAIVTVADDGGGSGMLREDLGILPPGDIRNCILALADTEPIMERLLQYRFKDGRLRGQNFGNLFLAAMDGISTNFEEAVQNMSEVLAVTGKVLPVTLDDITLCCELEDGHIICGESKIGGHNETHPGRIKRVFMEPENPRPLKDALEAIKEADVIVLGPGSLYTSILPNLLIPGVFEAIKQSRAAKVYVCNVMTQPGETDGYSVCEHIEAIEKHTLKGIIDCCIVNDAQIPEELRKKYMEDGSEAVRIDMENLNGRDIKIIRGDFAFIDKNLVRHNAQKLAGAIIELVAETVLAVDKKRTIDYYYAKNRLSAKNRQ